jgi:predicted CXXCH cytochrome family protein
MTKTKGFFRKTMVMSILTFLGMNLSLFTNNFEWNMGCPVKTPSEFKKIEDDQIFIKIGSDSLGYKLDSNLCVQCHDGVIAKDIIFKDYQNSDKEMFNQNREYLSPGSNHPVNIPYPAGNEKYVPKSFLNANLKLTNGKVTCYTCHNGNYGSAKLSLTLDRSELCIACHIK